MSADPPSTWADYAALRSDPARWLPLAADVLRHHAPPAAELRPIDGGTNLVAALGESLVVKLFPPFLHHQFRSERLALPHFSRRLSVETPELVAEGTHAGYDYLLMSYVPGVPLETVWQGQGEATKGTILRRIGSLIREVQDLDPGALAGLEPKWDVFMSAQIQQCRARHQRQELPVGLLDDIERYLADTGAALPRDFRSVVLTGEYTPGNLLMTRAGSEFRLTGMIDFGDAMFGFGEYDLLGPGTFLVSGDAERLGQLLAGYGYERGAPPGLTRRLMRLCLLHCYSDFRVQIRIEGWEERARNLDELEALLWPGRSAAAR